jgi:hypothetical protein
MYITQQFARAKFKLYVVIIFSLNYFCGCIKNVVHAYEFFYVYVCMCICFNIINYHEDDL